MLQRIENLLNEKSLRYKTQCEIVKTEKRNLKTSEQSEQDLNSAQEIIQTVSKTIQENAHSKIASVVSRCLESVFDEPYKFQISFERKRGKTEAKISFVRDEVEVDPMTASGGGVVDVAAFALRLSCLMLSVPPVRKTLILDEPFKFVSQNYRDRIRELLESLSEDLKVQIIMVTHIPEIESGKIIEIG
tara:strand:+ start:584 stop:1150 length:567 start_codon:yes stop_codon:yes gene_type:complete